jgi:hypothetical protein
VEEVKRLLVLPEELREEVLREVEERKVREEEDPIKEVA